MLSYFVFLIMSNAVFLYHSLHHHAFMVLSHYYEHCRFSLCHHAVMFLSPYYEHCRFSLSLSVSLCFVTPCVTLLSCFCHLIMSTVAFLCHSICHHAVMFFSPYYEHCHFSLSNCVTMLSCFCRLIMNTVAFLFHSMCHHAAMFLSPYYEHCRFSLSLYVSTRCHVFVTLL